MTNLRSCLRVLFKRQLRAADLRALWQRLMRPSDFEDTADDFAPTRWISRADEMADGPGVPVGEGLELSEEELRTLPAELQDAFPRQSGFDELGAKRSDRKP